MLSPQAQQAMVHYSQQNTYRKLDAHSFPDQAKKFLSAKINEFAEKSSTQRIQISPKEITDAESHRCNNHQNLDKNGNNLVYGNTQSVQIHMKDRGVESSHGCYDDDESLDKDSNLLIYGNPLWAEEQSPYHGKEIVKALAAGDTNDMDAIVNGHTREALNGHCHQSVVVSPQNNHLMYSNDASDGEDPGDARFWKLQFHDVESKSTSQSSSIYEFDSLLETKDFHEQGAPVQCSTKATNLGHTRRLVFSNGGNFNHNDKLADETCLHAKDKGRPFLHNKVLLKHAEGGVPEVYLQNVKSNMDIWSPENLCRENNEFEESKVEQWKPTSKYTSVYESEWPVGGYKNRPPPDQQLYNPTAFDVKNAIANNKHSMLWNNHESYKRDVSTLSPQEEDYLYQNSDVLAAFEMEDYGNKNKRVRKEIKTHGKEGLNEDPCEEYIHESLLKQNDSFKSADNISHSYEIDNMEERGQMLKKTKETSHFDDTSSWSTDNSEELAPQQQCDEALKSLASLEIEDGSNLSSKHPYGKEKDDVQFARNVTTSSASSESEESAKSNPALTFRKVDGNEFKNRQQDFDMMEKVIKETNVSVETDVKALKEEVLKLKKENGRLDKLLKENEQQIDGFSKERALWEQRKVSEMSMFNAFKEDETQRLRRERAKLEKQAKLLAQLPSKKERNEMEELRAKIANLTTDNLKKESLQNLTINRLRRTIADLMDQIHALQEEVKRYERFLQAEWDANEDIRKKFNLPRITADDKLQSISSGHEQDAQSLNTPSRDMKLQHGSHWNRVSTTMHWTRA